MASDLANLATCSVVTFFAWKHYKDKTYPDSAKYSSFAPRLLAGFVDGLVLWPLGLILLIFPESGLTNTLSILGIEIIWAAYTVIMHAKYGQTLGKMVCKVRVVDAKTSDALSFGQATVREIPWIALSALSYFYHLFTNSLTALELLSWLPLGWLAIEVITMLTNEKRRALHDFLAGTMVVRTNLQSV